MLKALNKKIKDLGKNIENLIIALENGENVDLISNRITEKRKELDITKKQYEAESNKLINLTERQIKVFLKQLKDGNIDDIKYRKMLVNLFVNKIYVYDELTIIFNIGKTPLTVNKALLKDVENNLKNSVSSYLDNLGSPKKVIAYAMTFLFSKILKKNKKNDIFKSIENRRDGYGNKRTINRRKNWANDNNRDGNK